MFQADEKKHKLRVIFCFLLEIRKLAVYSNKKNFVIRVPLRRTTRCRRSTRFDFHVMSLSDSRRRVSPSKLQVPLSEIVSGDMSETKVTDVSLIGENKKAFSFHRRNVPIQFF